MKQRQFRPWNAALAFTITTLVALITVSQGWAAAGDAFKCRQIYKCTCGCGLDASSFKDYRGCGTFAGVMGANETQAEATARCCKDALAEVTKWCSAFGKGQTNPISACSVASESCTAVPMRTKCSDGF